MFNLTIVDHIRLSFGNVAQNYTRHARAADRLTRLALEEASLQNIYTRYFESAHQQREETRHAA